jgi:iron(III) transport system permease protein
VVVLLPVGAVCVGVLTAGSAPWTRAADAGWVSLAGRTLALLALTLAGTLLLGTALAWLTTAYRFPGRRALSWLLVLPTAVPAYILGLVWSSLLSFAGPVQRAWRALPGDLPFPPVRTLPVAAAVLTLSLYPYVYLLARTAFAHQAATPYAAARTLGLGPWAATRRVVLPLARPSLAAGALLVGIETLSDFATVHYFGVDTLAVGIYRVWRGQFDRPAATVLALLVLLLALVPARRRARAARAGALQPAGVEVDAGRAGAPDRRPGVGRNLPRARRAHSLCRRPPGDTGLLVGGDAAAGTRWQLRRGLPAGCREQRAGRRAGGARCRRAGAAAGAPEPARRPARRAAHGPGLAVGICRPRSRPRHRRAAGPGRAARGLVAAGLPGGGLVTGSVSAIIVVYVVRFLALGFTSTESRMSNVPMSMTRRRWHSARAPGGCFAPSISRWRRRASPSASSW